MQKRTRGGGRGGGRKGEGEEQEATVGSDSGLVSGSRTYPNADSCGWLPYRVPMYSYIYAMSNVTK